MGLAGRLPQTAGCTTPQQEPAPKRVLDEEVIWADAHHTRALFVPEAILNAVSLDQIPMQDSERAGLEQQLAPLDEALLRRAAEYARKTGRTCPVDSSYAPEPQPADKSLLDLLVGSGFRILVVGQVTQVVPGYNVGYRHVASMVQIQVEEVLSNTAGWPAIGDHVFYEQAHGKINVRGREICIAAEHKEFYRAVVGERVLLLGLRQDADLRFLFGTYVWPVSTSGAVLPEPYGALRHEGPVALESIRSAFKRQLPGAMAAP